MAQVRTYDKRKLVWWALPAVAVALIVSAFAGFFFGRVCTVTCNRTHGACRVEIRGLLYPIDDEVIPLNEIEGVKLQTMRSEGANKRPAIEYYTLVIDRGIKKPLKIIPSYDVESYDPLGGADATVTALEALGRFLNDPAAPEVTVSFGTHRTGWAVTGFLFLLGLIGIFRKSVWHLQVTAQRGKTARRLVFDDESSDSDASIRRVEVDIEVYAGFSRAWLQGIWLYEGCRPEIGRGVMVHQPWGKTDGANGHPFPSLMPGSFKKELAAILETELSAISNR